MPTPAATYVLSRKAKRQLWQRPREFGLVSSILTYNELVRLHPLRADINDPGQDTARTWGWDIGAASRKLLDTANAEGRCRRMKFNECWVFAEPGDSIESVVQQYWDGVARSASEFRTHPRYARYRRRCEHQARARAVERRRRVQALGDELAAAPAEPTLKDPAAWAESARVNTDPYGRAVVTFADRWARLMERRLELGEHLEDIADSMCKLADAADDGGVTGFQYGCIVSMLAHCWAHGERLRRWHNKDTQIGSEGDEANEKGGVLNPALLRVGGAS